MDRDHLFGYLGLDTKYERELMYYRPLLKVLRGTKGSNDRTPISDNKLLRIEVFKLTDTIQAYRDLIARIKALMARIEKREQPSVIEQLNTLYQDRKFEELIQYELTMDKVTMRNYIDYYYICLILLNSLETRLVQILEKYGSQFTEAKSEQAIAAAEEQSIEELRILLFSRANEEETVSQVVNDTDHSHGHDDDTDEYPIDREAVMRSDVKANLDYLIEEKNLFHQTIASLSMIHKNRCSMIDSVLDIMEALVDNAFSLYREGIQEGIELLHTNNGANILKISTMSNFEELRNKQTAKKRKLFKYQEKIESFSFDKQFFYQQLEVNYNSNAMTLAGNMLYSDNESINRFNHVILNSIEKNKQSYNGSLKDALNYYKEEAGVLKSILDLSIDKEELRVFYHIADAIEHVSKMDTEWMNRFLEKMNTTY